MTRLCGRCWSTTPLSSRRRAALRSRSITIASHGPTTACRSRSPIPGSASHRDDTDGSYSASAGSTGQAAAAAAGRVWVSPSPGGCRTHGRRLRRRERTGTGIHPPVQSDAAEGRCRATRRKSAAAPQAAMRAPSSEIKSDRRHLASDTPILALSNADPRVGATVLPPRMQHDILAGGALGTP